MVNGDTKACSELTAVSDDAMLLCVPREDDGDASEPSTERCEVEILEMCGSVSLWEYSVSSLASSQLSFL